MKIADGTYVGSAAARTISGLGFAAADWRMLIIKGGANHSVIRLNTMTGDAAKTMASTATIAATIGCITGLIADGFSLGTDPKVNAAGTDYYWVALGDDGSNDIATGTYTGNAADNRDLTSLTTFVPAAALIFGAGARTPRWRPSLLTGDQSLNFTNQGVNSNMIQSLYLDGFQVGSSGDVNANTEVFHWLLLRAQAGLCEAATYTGDDVDDRDIDGLFTFEPRFVFVKGVGATHARGRFAPMVGDLSFDFAASAPGPNGIQAIRPTGIQVGGVGGASDRVNAPGVTHYTLAVGSGGTGGAFPAPTNLTASASGTTAIDLSWTDNTTDEEGFEVWRSTDQVNWSLQNTRAANVTTYTNSGLATTTTYYYRVRAVKSSATVFSSYSNIASATSGGAAANLLTLGTLDLGATDETITIEQHYTGDANRNATCPEAVVTTSASAALNATTVTLSAPGLPFDLPTSSRLDFFDGTRVVTAVLTASRTAGQTSLAVSALPYALPSGSTAWLTGVQFKRQADTQWRFGVALARKDVDVTGLEIADAKGRAFYGVLQGLAAGTTYDLRLRFADADGVTGTNPVVTTFATVTSPVTADTGLTALTNRWVDSVGGSDVTGDGLSLGTAWRTPAQAIARYTAGDSPANWYVQLVGATGGRYYPSFPPIVGTNAARSLTMFGATAPATTDGAEINTGNWVVIEPGQTGVETANGLPLRYIVAPVGATDADIPTGHRGPWVAVTIAGHDTNGVATGRNYSVYRWTGVPLEPRNLFASATRNAFPTRVPWWERTAAGYVGGMATSTVNQWVETMFTESQTRNEGHLYGMWSDNPANVVVATGGAAAGATSIPLTVALPVALPAGAVLRFAPSSGLGLPAVYATLNGAQSAGATTLVVNALPGAITAAWQASIRSLYCRIHDPANDGLATVATHAGINPNTRYLRFSPYQTETINLDAPNLRLSRLFVVGGESGVKVRAGAANYVIDHCGLTASYWCIEHLGTKPDTFGEHGWIEHNWFKHSASYGYPRHNGIVGWNAIKNSLGRNAEQASLIHFKGGHKWAVVRHNRLTDTFDCIGMNPDALVATGTGGFTRYHCYGLVFAWNVMARAADDGIDQGKQAVNTTFHDNTAEDMPAFMSPGPTRIGPCYIYRNRLWRSTPRGTGRGANGYAELSSGKFFKYSKDSNPNANLIIAHNTHFTDQDSTSDTFFVGAAGIGLQHAGGGNLNESFHLYGNVFRGTYNVHNATTSNNIAADDYNLYATSDPARGFLLNYAGGGGDLLTIAAYRSSLVATGANPNGTAKGATSNKLSGVDFDFGAEATLDALLVNGPTGNLAMAAVVPMRPVPNISDQLTVDYAAGSAPTIGWYVPAGAATGPTILTTTLPNGTVGVAYSQTLSATGGTAPYTWAITTGSAPAGLSLSSGGVLSGTPSAAATTSFTVTATDAGSLTDTQALSVTIAATADTTPPTFSNIIVTPTPTGATITWTTNEPSDTQVEYGITTAYGSSSVLNPALVTSPHTATLSGLAEATPYHYRVRSRDAAGNLGIGSDGTFTTLLAAPSTLTAVAVSSTRIDLTWSDASLAESGFELEWSPDGVAGWQTLIALPANAQSHSDTTLVANTTRYYRLRAYRQT